jgi:pilus assembly protein CpaB
MKRPIVFVMLAGIGALLAAFVVFSAIRKRDSEVQRAIARSVEVLVAARDIPLGTKLDPTAVKLVRWARDSVPEGAFTDPNAVAGSFARSQFVANEPVVASKLFMGEKAGAVMPLLIPTGMRAMSVPVDEVSDVAGFVAPHTRVDVLVAVSGSGPAEASFSRMVLQNIEVLAVAQEIEHVKDEPEVVKVVTLLVNPADAERLTLASHEGMLRLAMRNYSDARTVATRGIALNDLMHGGGSTDSILPVMQTQPAPPLAARPAHGSAPLRIEVMRDGRSSEAISFVKSGAGTGASVRMHEDAPSVSERQPPAAPGLADSPDSPVSSAKPDWSASFAAPPASAFEAVRSWARDGSASITPAPLRPGDPGYRPAPKLYEVR